MSVFSHKEFQHHEQVSFFEDPVTGLRAIIAVHNTNLGSALGGCRMWAYENDEQALKDVLRLSRGMTYKAAITGLPLGGGKSVAHHGTRRFQRPQGRGAPPPRAP
jgi:leucine dehydrogenase